jgi:hypothetical protein
MQVAKRYTDTIQEKISEIVQKDSKETIEDKWKKYKNVIVASAESILGFEERSRNEWYDEECRRLVEERNEARLKLLERHTRSSANEYQNKRRLAKAECKKNNVGKGETGGNRRLSKRKET